MQRNLHFYHSYFIKCKHKVMARMKPSEPQNNMQNSLDFKTTVGSITLQWTAINSIEVFAKYSAKYIYSEDISCAI